MKEFIVDEIRKAVLWFRSVLSMSARWMFGMFIRMVLMLAVLFFLGGGYSFLKSYFGAKEKTELSIQTLQNPADEGHRTSEALYQEGVGFGGSEELEQRIRSGQSQVRSWEYRFRSLKRDIERIFRSR